MVELRNQKLICADTFDGMATIPDGSVAMVLSDLPYGTTQNKWDTVIPFEPLWAEYWRVCKPNAAIVLTAQCPFDKILGSSQLQHLKYEWIWEKHKPTGHLNAKKQPLKSHENVLVFYRRSCIYNPQGLRETSVQVSRTNRGNYGACSKTTLQTQTGYPKSIQKFQGDVGFHPTQKPVALFEYLMRTYTNEGETVLDNTAGSCTTAIAAINSGRRSICIERDTGYFMKAIGRVASHATA